MKCNVCGTENAEGALFCVQCGNQLEQEEVIVEETAPASDQWYYVANGASTGPFSPETMGQLIQNGTLNGLTYVWKAGMADWVHLENTELAAWLPARPVSASSSPLAGGVHEKSLLLYVLLSICTCGIWYLVWLFQLARDINLLLEAQHKPRSCDPLVVLLLNIVSCSLYNIYFFWRSGKALASLDYPGYKPANDTVVVTILSVFAPLVSLVILQSDINDIVRFAE